MPRLLTSLLLTNFLLWRADIKEQTYLFFYFIKQINLRTNRDINKRGSSYYHEIFFFFGVVGRQVCQKKQSLSLSFSWVQRLASCISCNGASLGHHGLQLRKQQLHLLVAPSTFASLILIYIQIQVQEDKWRFDVGPCLWNACQRTSGIQQNEIP